MCGVLLSCAPLLPPGQTALHWAAKHGKEDMARAMLKAGADINTRAVSVTHDTAALIHTHAICMRGETRAHTHMLYV